MIKSAYEKHQNLIHYLLNSVIVTVLDLVVVWIMFNVLDIDIIISNTTGIIIGFLLHYMLSTKVVFKTDYGLSGFVIYLITFFIGVVMADSIIYYVYHLSHSLDKTLSFLISKGLSIVLPFFVMYFLRLYLYRFLNTRRAVHE